MHRLSIKYTVQPVIKTFGLVDQVKNLRRSIKKTILSRRTVWKLCLHINLNTSFVMTDTIKI